MANFGALGVAVFADTAQLVRDISSASTAAGRQAAANIQSGLNRLPGNQIGQRFGSGLAGGVARASTAIGRGLVGAAQLGGRALLGAGRAVGQSLAGVGKVALGVGTVVGGIGFSKGFQRLTSIDNATAKLTGLGHSAGSVQTIMDNALASVKGTAFGLGDAAGQAATLVAAGIKPGQELTRTLKLTADAATIAGVDLNEMGSVFGKVAASGKLTTEAMQQIQERGVPVMQFLAKETGKSVADVQKDLSAGKISFATFQNAMEQGVGGAALSSGKTFQGAMANVQAALGRLGAAVLGPAFKQMAPFFQRLIGTIDKLGPSADGVGKRLGAFLAKGLAAVEKLLAGGGKLGKFLDPLKSALSSIGPMLAPLAAGLGALGGAKLAGSLGPLGALLPKINPVVAIIATLVAQTPELQDAFKGVMTAIKPLLPIITRLASIFGGALASAVEAIAPVLAELAKTVAGVLGEAMQALVPIISRLGPIFGKLAQIAGALLMPVIKAIGPIFAALMKVLDQVLNAIWPMLPAVQQLAGIVGKVLAKALLALVPLLPSIAKLLVALLKVITPLLPIINLLATVLGAVLVFAINVLVAVLQKPIQWLANLATAIAGFVPKAGSALAALPGIVTRAFVTAWNAAYRFTTQLIGTIVRFIASLPSKAASALGRLASVVVSLHVRAFQAAYRAVVSGVGSVVRFIAGLPGKAASALGRFGSTLAGVFSRGFSAAARAVAGGVSSVIRTVASIPGKVGAALGSLGSRLLGPFKSAFGAVTRFIDSVINGIKRSVNAVIGAVQSAANAPFNALRSAMSAVGRIGFTVGGQKIGGQSVGAGPAKITLPSITVPKISLKLPDFSGRVPGPWRFPRLAEGGTVNPRTGGMLALLAEAGRPERVTPLDRNGMSAFEKRMLGAQGAVINVYPRPEQSEVEIAQQVNRTLAWAMAGGQA